MPKPRDTPTTPSTIDCISEQELATRTTLSQQTLLTMRRNGGGPPFAKLGGRIVYRVVDVERWLEERTHAKAPAAAAEVTS